MRRFELDGLRGLAALSVVVGHAIGMLPEQGVVAWLQHSPLRILWDGEAAVTLFFVLSGFVLSLPAAAGKPLHVPTFWLKRVLRLYPAYWFAVGLSLALMLVHNPVNLQGLSPWIQSFWQAPVPVSEIVKTLMMAGPQFNTRLIDPPVWSLLIEMSVSVILPVFIIAIQRWQGPLMWAAVAGGALVLTLAQGRFRFLDVFLLGVALAFTYKPIVAYLTVWPRVAKTFLLIAGIALYGVSQLGLPEGFALRGEIQAIGSTVLMLLAMSSARLRDMLSSRVPHFLGEVSYSLYLLHFPILLVTASLLYPIAGIWVVWAVALILSLALAYAVYRGIEVPFIRLGQRLQPPSRNRIVQA